MAAGVIHEADCDGECLGELIERLVAREFGVEGIALLDGLRRPGCVRVVLTREPTCACGRYVLRDHVVYREAAGTALEITHSRGDCTRERIGCACGRFDAVPQYGGTWEEATQTRHEWLICTVVQHG